MQLRHILCPVDFSESTAFGLQVAESLAKRFTARITLLHVLPALQLTFRVPVDAEDLYEQWEREAQAQLDELIADSRGRGVAIKGRVGRGSAFHEIADVAEDAEVDLVVLPTRSRAGLDHLLYGSVAERVVRASRRPVLAVPPSLDGMREFAPQRILVATDFSRAAEAALEAAMDLASAFAAELVLAHVFTYERLSEEGTDWWRPTFTHDQVESAIAATTSRLEGLADRARRSGMEVSSELGQGSNPAAELVRLVEEDGVDLVVVGKHGTGFLKHLLLGSTAEKLVRSCPVPLLALPAPDVDTAEGTIPDPVPA